MSWPDAKPVTRWTTQQAIEEAEEQIALAIQMGAKADSARTLPASDSYAAMAEAHSSTARTLLLLAEAKRALGSEAEWT